MKCIRSFILAFLLLKYAESCTTPLGVRSQCTNVKDCTPLASASHMKEGSLYNNFMKSSICGYQGNTTLVCCGPLPVVDPVMRIDSYTAPAGLCGKKRQKRQVFGGRDARLADYPWMALLRYLDKTNTLSFQCAGSLINQRYVLTAAHCVTGAIETKYGKPIIARLGEHDITKEIDCEGDFCADPVQDIYIMSIHPHYKYSDDAKTYHNDIAILRLTQRVKLSFFVKPICLIASNVKLPTDTHAVVAGWGYMLNGKKSDVKQVLNLKIYDKARCMSFFNKRNGLSIVTTQICAGGAFREDTCTGDSGGPLMIKNRSGRWEAGGIVSFGLGCGMDDVPGIYTAVSMYIDWIEKTLQTTNVYT